MHTSTRIPSRCFVPGLTLGDGSRKGNAVVPKPIRWWFVVECLSAARARGERSSWSDVIVDVGGGLRRRGRIEGAERRLDDKMRLRRWRDRTLLVLVLEV